MKQLIKTSLDSARGQLPRYLIFFILFGVDFLLQMSRHSGHSFGESLRYVLVEAITYSAAFIAIGILLGRFAKTLLCIIVSWMLLVIFVGVYMRFELKTMLDGSVFLILAATDISEIGEFLSGAVSVFVIFLLVLFSLISWMFFYVISVTRSLRLSSGSLLLVVLLCFPMFLVNVVWGDPTYLFKETFVWCACC